MDYDEEVEYIRIGKYRADDENYRLHDGSISWIQIKTENKTSHIIGVSCNGGVEEVEIHGLLEGMSGKYGEIIESVMFSYLTTSTPQVSLENLADSPY